MWTLRFCLTTLYCRCCARKINHSKKVRRHHTSPRPKHLHSQHCTTLRFVCHTRRPPNCFVEPHSLRGAAAFSCLMLFIKRVLDFLHLVSIATAVIYSRSSSRLGRMHLDTDECMTSRCYPFSICTHGTRGDIYYSGVPGTKDRQYISPGIFTRDSPAPSNFARNNLRGHKAHQCLAAVIYRLSSPTENGAGANHTHQCWEATQVGTCRLHPIR